MEDESDDPNDDEMEGLNTNGTEHIVQLSDATLPLLDQDMSPEINPLCQYFEDNTLDNNTPEPEQELAACLHQYASPSHYNHCSKQFQSTSTSCMKETLGLSLNVTLSLQGPLCIYIYTIYLGIRMSGHLCKYEVHKCTYKWNNILEPL